MTNQSFRLRNSRSDLMVARQHAASGRFDDFLTEARTCYTQAQRIAPTDPRAAVNLANLVRDAGEHAKARRLYTDLLHQLPDHPVTRRNALTGLEYDPKVPDAERLVQAQAWGDWAIARAGGARPRPALQQRTQSKDIARAIQRWSEWQTRSNQ